MKSMGRRTYLISLGISILFTLFILSGQWSRTEGLSKGYYMAQGIACLLLFFCRNAGDLLDPGPLWVEASDRRRTGFYGKAGDRC